MSDTSDPSGAGRGDRKRARALIDAAYAGGRITAADRALRIERVDAAATKGDLAGLTAGLEAPATPPQQPYHPQAPQQPPAPSQQPPWTQQPSSGQPVPGPQPMQTTSFRGPQALSGVKYVRRGIGCLVAIVTLSVVLPCIGGVLGIFASIFTGDFEFSTDSNDLDTTSGWTGFVEDVRAANGTSMVERVRFDGSSASVFTRTPTGEAKESRWSNGVFGSSTTRTTSLPPPATFDLDPLTEVLGNIRDRAVERLGVSDPRSVQADVLPSGITVTVIAETGQITTASYTLFGDER